MQAAKQVCTQGALCRGPLDIAIHTKYIHIGYGPHGFIEDLFYGFLPLKFYGSY